jgi:hypothetical protein
LARLAGFETPGGALAAKLQVSQPEPSMSPELDRRRLLAGLAFAPLAGPAGLPADAVAEDVRLLRQAYEALHPGLLRYTTADVMAARFARLERSGRVSLERFYLDLSRVLASVRCGHTYANFYNQRAPIRAALFDHADRVPFQFVWLGQRMVVTADPWGLGVKPGDEIVSLNGVPAGRLLQSLLAVTRADGGNDGKRRALLSVQAVDNYESFDVFYPLLFGSRSRHTAVVEGADGRRRTLSAAAVSLEQRRALRPPKIDDRDDTPTWTIRRQGGAAILTMPGWGLYNAKWDWRAWLDQQIDGLVADQVARLVIDLRNNEGGLDCGDAVIARLIDSPIRKDFRYRLTRYRRIPEGLQPYLDTWDRSFDDWGEDAQPFDDRFFSLRQGDGEGAMIAPKGPRYRGEVRVLIGPQNSSATFQFAQMLRQERLAVLVGETTGGNRRGINGGAFYFLRLPRTGVEVDLPLIGTFPKVAQPDAGVDPDLFAPRRRETLARGTDPAMAAALA